MKFHDWLRNYRRIHNLELQDISDKSGLATSLLSRIENDLTQVTLSSAVCICHGLEISLPELAKELEIYESMPKCQSMRVIHSSSSTFVLADVEKFLELYSQDNEAAAGILEEGVNNLPDPSTTQYRERIKSHPVSDRYRSRPIHPALYRYRSTPYPADIPAGEIKVVFKEGGILIPADIGAYARSLRTAISLNISLRGFAAKTGISRSALSRLETGLTDRILLDDIIALDQFLQTEGEILSIGWAAGEFQTGVIREKHASSPTPQPKRWTPEEYAVANALIRILRWYYHDEERRSQWLEQVRSEIDNTISDLPDKPESNYKPLSPSATNTPNKSTSDSP
ncbi:MAG: XRE family transcriptional regulator [Anaerolineales bacterium]|nr:XRE family transcriptional regulator [Anaerolineales bacterium]